jgi:hypothetical protein
MGSPGIITGAPAINALITDALFGKSTCTNRIAGVKMRTQLTIARK